MGFPNCSIGSPAVCENNEVLWYNMTRLWCFVACDLQYRTLNAVLREFQEVLTTRSGGLSYEPSNRNCKLLLLSCYYVLYTALVMAHLNKNLA